MGVRLLGRSVWGILGVHERQERLSGKDAKEALLLLNMPVPCGPAARCSR